MCCYDDPPNEFARFHKFKIFFSAASDFPEPASLDSPQIGSERGSATFGAAPRLIKRAVTFSNAAKIAAVLEWGHFFDFASARG